MSTSTSKSAKLKRPNGSGSTFISAQKPVVVQAVALDVHGVKRNKSFRFEVGNRASQARAENAATEWLSDMRRARELGQATFVANPKMLMSEFLDNWLASRKPPKISDSPKQSQRHLRQGLQSLPMISRSLELVPKLSLRSC